VAPDLSELGINSKDRNVKTYLNHGSSDSTNHIQVDNLQINQHKELKVSGTSS
jgi:hypothetical protein